jgi:hypothetical protein
MKILKNLRSSKGARFWRLKPPLTARRIVKLNINILFDV